MMEVHELNTAKFHVTYKHHVQFMLFHVWAHLSYKPHIKMYTCIKQNLLFGIKLAHNFHMSSMPYFNYTSFSMKTFCLPLI